MKIDMDFVRSLSKSERLKLFKTLISFYGVVELEARHKSLDLSGYSIDPKDVSLQKTANECLIIKL